MCSGLWEGAFGSRLDWGVAAVAVAVAVAAEGAGKLGYSGLVGVSLGDGFLLLASGAQTPVGLGIRELKSGPDDSVVWWAVGPLCGVCGREPGCSS